VGRVKHVRHGIQTRWCNMRLLRNERVDISCRKHRLVVSSDSIEARLVVKGTGGSC
jgi:hypothetical protein